MKMLHTLFRKFFTGNYNSSALTEAKQVMINYYSQQDVLQQKMKEKRLTHGDTVIANLFPVRLEKDFGKIVMYFCPMETIEILEIVANGDGGKIPDEARVSGLIMPPKHKPGLYKLKNVMLTSNGTMQVEATDKTIWEKVQFKLF